MKIHKYKRFIICCQIIVMSSFISIQKKLIILHSCPLGYMAVEPGMIILVYEYGDDLLTILIQPFPYTQGFAGNPRTFQSLLDFNF